MTQINVRVEERTKKAAGKVLADMGLDLSTGVNIFLNQVIVEKGLPFRPSKNPAVLAAKWDKEVEYALKHGRRYKRAEDIWKDLR